MGKRRKKTAKPDEYRMALRSVPEWDDDDRMDDIVVRDVASFRMEQMDDAAWWMCCNLDDACEERLTLWVTYDKKTKEIVVRVTEYPDGDHIYESD